VAVFNVSGYVGFAYLLCVMQSGQCSEEWNHINCMLVLLPRELQI
jgi:hypothetical protein